MEVNPLTAISPIDGRYRKRLEPLAKYSSEQALIRYRILVEVEYLIALNEVGCLEKNSLSSATYETLRGLYHNFSSETAKRVKEIEKRTNHDVKAIEYWLKEAFDQLGRPFSSIKEFIHFGLTSQDINNTAQPLMLRDAIEKTLIPSLEKLLQTLHTRAISWKGISMLAHTHGQAASPTKLGKEIQVFISRLQRQFTQLKALRYPAKFGGATGNFNAHYVVFPEIDWQQFANAFVNSQLRLSRSYPTTQIEHYDGLAEIFDTLRRINVILKDLSIDCWLYISKDYFLQEIKAEEVGSSAMPHKVNPIDFENAEGNLGLANALLEFLSRELPVSRLQRDLTDSTVMRNVGVALAHSLLAWQSIQKGLEKLQVNQEAISGELSVNWAVVAEPIQNLLRKAGYPNPYEALKSFTRGKKAIQKTDIHHFIDSLDIEESLKEKMRRITPENYTGDAGSIPQ